MARVVVLVLFLAACTATPPMPSPSPIPSDGGLAPMPTATSETSVSVPPPTRSAIPTPTAAPDTSPPSMSPAPSVGADLVGWLSGNAQLEGGCGWVTDDEGQRWEVIWPDGMRILFLGNVPRLVDRDGAVVAEAGARIWLNGIPDPPFGSFCMVGRMFDAHEVVRIGPAMPAPTVPPLSVGADLVGRLFVGPGFGSGWDVEGCPGLRFEGLTYLVQYPEGWVIRDGPSGIELVGPDGDVFAQEGDVVGVDGVVDGEGHFDCSGLVFHATGVVTTSPAPFRSYVLSCGPMPRAECEEWESGILTVAAREYPGETISSIHITGRDGDYQVRLSNGHLFGADVN